MLKQMGTMALSAGLVLTAAAGVSLAGAPSVSGTIDLQGGDQRTSPLTYGTDVAFAASVSGKVDAKASTYITVVCQQEGHVVYQWSSQDLAFNFPLVDQAGQGLDWDGTAAECQAALTYRIDRKNAAVIQTLDTVTFGVA